MPSWCSSCSFFFNDTATTEIYTLSLHDALPIYWFGKGIFWGLFILSALTEPIDRKSTRLNSSHLVISYAVFCFKKKKAYYHARPASCIGSRCTHTRDTTFAD